MFRSVLLREEWPAASAQFGDGRREQRDPTAKEKLSAQVPDMLCFRCGYDFLKLSDYRLMMNLAGVLPLCLFLFVVGILSDLLVLFFSFEFHQTVSCMELLGFRIFKGNCDGVVRPPAALDPARGNYGYVVGIQHIFFYILYF